jgi:GT2 family glycosyltransferase
MKQPFCSIVIPTYNRPERLANCLEAITQQDYPRDQFEVVVVDDGSPTSMAEVVEPFRDRFNLTLIRQENAGPAKARNVGASRASGKYLVFTDDDCTPKADWLKALTAQFEAKPNDLIGGQTLNALPENLFSTASQILIDYIYSYYNLEAESASFFASNNFAMPADPFRLLGGFDTSFPLAAGEDREFCDRWLHHGYPMSYAPDVQIYHAHYLTLAKFWRQHFNYGRGAFCFHQLRAQRTTNRIKVEPLTFYFRLLTFPFRQPSSQPALLLSGLMVLSQVANVAGFFWERSRHSPTKPTLSVDAGQ